MPRLLNTLPMILALSLGCAVAAQESATTEPETETAAEAEAQTESESQATSEAPQSEADGSETEAQAEPADDPAQDSAAQDEDPTYVKETYGDWQLKCFRTESEEELCQMYQLLREQAGNPVAEFSIFKLPQSGQAKAGATIVVPLGTLLTEEMRISIDGGKAKTFPYAFCSVVGCYARIGLDAGDVEAFKRGAEANLQIVPAQAPDQKVSISVSLKGFTAAYENVSTIEQ